MTLTRNPRNDRRRRVLLESVSQDPELVVETARARRKVRDRRKENDEDAFDNGLYRDPGYSQAVRRACQQRIVQLIPVKRGTVAVWLTSFWSLFGLLLLAHFLLFSWGADPNKNGSTSSYLASLPIGQLFHLRSPHGIAHWLSCQLWLMTALICWMIFSLRRHKLDDYKARYRIWILVAVAAAFSSFDASTSVLQLVGMSIDGWTRKEIGYGGWPLVLASFASLVGVLGIRISAELKTVPSGVASWIIGLLAWASAALLGTGILRIDIAPEYLDLLVGGLWLGGVLAVFQAVSLYLRTTYIQAQKRFLQRSGCELSPIQWGMPKVGSGSKNRDARTRDNNADAEAEELQDESHKSRRWKMPWKKSRTSEGEELLQDEEDLDSDARETKGTDAKPKPGKLFGLIPNRQMRNETLEDEPIGEDDGGEVDEGLKKTQGWFGIGGNKAKDNEDSSTRKSERSEQPNKRKLWSRKPKDDADELGEESRDSNAEGAPRKKLGLPKWPTRTKASATAPPPDHSTSQAEPGAKKKWGTGLSSFRKNKPEGSDASPDEVSKDKTSKGKMFGLRKNKSEEAPGTNSSADTAEKPTKSSRLFGAGKKAAKNEPTETKPKKGWFGFINDMKLKPPPDIDDELGERNNTTRAEARKPSPPVQAPPVPKAAATATPVPIKSSAPVPSTSSYDEDDDDEDGEYGSRPLSKSERKRLKKQQDRRAG